MRMIIFFVFLAAFLCYYMDNRERLALKNNQIRWLNTLKNNHMIPREPIKRAFFDDKEILWVITIDKDGKEHFSRADGKPSYTESKPYPYYYLNKLIYI